MIKIFAEENNLVINSAEHKYICRKTPTAEFSRHLRNL